MLDLAPSLTQRDLEERKMFVTASDAAAVTGTSPWANQADLFLEKTGKVAPIDESEVMYWGHLMEEPLLRFTLRAIRKHMDDNTLKITRQGIRRRHKNGVMSATLDARFKGKAWAIEAKTHAACHGNIDLTGWGDPWTDDIPANYLDQVCAQFACSPDIEVIFVVLSVARRVPTIYMVERKDHLDRIAFVENACCDFNDKHLVPSIPPGMAPHLGTIKRDIVPRKLEPAAKIDDGILERHAKLAKLKRKLEKKKDELDAEIRTKLMGASCGRSPKGHEVKIKECHRGGFVAKPCDYTTVNIKLVDPSQPWG